MNADRTRIKICGLTRPEDVDAAVALGADALGFVFYPPSPRFLKPKDAAELVRRVPPFVTATGLFVNAARAEIEAVFANVPLTLLQFHGDESEADCAAVCAPRGLPFVKAARVRPGFDVLEFAARYPRAQGLLVDAFVEGYGGGGAAFDWSLLPENVAEKVALPIILSGGLNSQNVAQAIARIAPYAVDVSSGVERAKGVKDPERMHLFVEAVRQADEKRRTAVRDASKPHAVDFE